MRASWFIVLPAILALVLWASLLFPTPVGSPRVPLYDIAAIGLTTTVILLGWTWSFWRPEEGKDRTWTKPIQPVMAATVFAGAILFAGVLLGTVRPLPAALVLICGVATLTLATLAGEMIKDGGAIEMNSHWGGLGGSQGGWRVSQALALTLAALIFLGATIALGMSGDGTAGQSDGQSGSSGAPSQLQGQTPPVRQGNGASGGKEAGSAGTAQAAQANAQAAQANAQTAQTNAQADPGNAAGAAR